MKKIAIALAASTALAMLSGCATTSPTGDSDPRTYHWLRNVAEGENAIAGTRDWTRFEAAIPATSEDYSFAVLLRSDGNAGSAWFDDVEVVDASGTVLKSFGFDKNEEGFRPEHDPTDAMAFDATVGHNAPGSLRVSATDGYNGWLFSHIVTAGNESTYVIRGWVKLDKATGKTYAAAAMNGVE